MRLHLLDRYDITTIKRKRLKWNFEPITDWGRLESKHSIRKMYKIEKTLTSLFFRPTFEPLLFETKSRVSFRVRYNLVSIVLKIFFQDNTSAITHLNWCVMADLWATEHSGLTFTMKNIHSFDVSSVEVDVFLYKLEICEFFQVTFCE